MSHTTEMLESLFSESGTHAMPPPKVDGFVPQTQHVNLAIVSQGDEGWKMLSSLYVTNKPVTAWAKTAHVREWRPEYGVGLQVKALKTFQAVPSSLGGNTAHIRQSRPDSAVLPSPRGSWPRGASTRPRLCIHITCIYIHTHTHTHVYIHIYIYIYVYTYI